MVDFEKLNARIFFNANDANQANYAKALEKIRGFRPIREFRVRHHLLCTRI
jgi:hypothetical protein